MNKAIWFVKQLLPLAYWTEYEQDGKKYFHIWRMWFGKCFNQSKFQITN
jgi:hypothetical protein